MSEICGGSLWAKLALLALVSIALPVTAEGAEGAEGGATADKGPSPELAPIAGLLGEIFVHETGHAVAMLSMGVGIDSFRPFPNICGGKLVGGCVIPGSTFGRGLLPFLSSRSKRVIISAAGSVFSMIGAVAISPQLPRIDNDFNRVMLDSMTYLEVRDFPFYVAVDLLGFNGDWYSVTKEIGISLWWFVPLAVGQFIVLDEYWQKYHDEAEAKYNPEEAGKQGAASAIRRRGIKLPGLRLIF